MVATIAFCPQSNRILCVCMEGNTAERHWQVRWSRNGGQDSVAWLTFLKSKLRLERSSYKLGRMGGGGSATLDDSSLMRRMSCLSSMAW